jgi:hypothetical protein
MKNVHARAIALLGDNVTAFTRYLRGMEFTCEAIPSELLLAPFFSLTDYKLVIIPAGFGSVLYSKLLPRLRAKKELLTNFVGAGGTLLVSGAFSEKNPYNWLPLTLEYIQKEQWVTIEMVADHHAALIVETNKCMCDGYFTAIGSEGEIILENEGGKAILVVASYGAGEIIATTIHEYPSERFISYCVGEDV